MPFKSVKKLAPAFLSGAPDTRDIVVCGISVHKFSGIVVQGGGLVMVQREAFDKIRNDAGDVVAKNRVVWWELPGGKANPEDFRNPQHVVAREVHEETGLTARVGSVLWVDSASHRKGKMQAFYPCAVIEGNLCNAFPKEHLDVKAFNPQDLQELRRSGAVVRVPEGILNKFEQDPTFFVQCVDAHDIPDAIRGDFIPLDQSPA